MAGDGCTSNTGIENNSVSFKSLIYHNEDVLMNLKRASERKFDDIPLGEKPWLSFFLLSLHAYIHVYNSLFITYLVSTYYIYIYI